MKKRLLHFFAALSIAAVPTALVGAATGNIDTTGPDSTNSIDFNNEAELDVENSTNASLTNNNPQTAYSGDVTVEDNTTGGNGESGGASNSSSLSVDAEVDNSGGASNLCDCMMGGNGDESEISNTGPDSDNTVSFSNSWVASISNSTNLSVTNNNSQTAYSGDVDVNHNTTAGDATSGDASNESTTEISFSVTN